MRLLSLLAATIAAIPPALPASAQWPNEPAGSVNALDCPFSGQLCQGMFNVYGNQPFANDPAAPLSPSGVLDHFLPAGATTGGGQFGYHLQNNLGYKPRELYVGTWWKTNPEFDGNVNNCNKMIFVQGQESGGGGNFIMWGGPVEGTKAIMFATQQDQQFGAGNCHIPNWQGYGVCQSSTAFPNGTHGGFYNNVGSGLVGPGTGWHRIETYQKSSSTYTSRDGIIRMWLDGSLILNVQNANLLPNGFTDVQYNSTWDGSSNLQCDVRDCTRERHHYYDHLRISIPNCGAGGCPAPAYLIINSSLPATRTGTPYVATLTAEGGTKPYSWFLQSGNLPAGLTLNQSTGVISGTPTCVGRSDFTIRVTDGSSPALAATKSYTIITSGTSTSCPSLVVTATKTEMESAHLRAKAVVGKVMFSMPQIGNSTCLVTIFDLAGKKVYARTVSSNGQKEVWIEIVLKNGIYFARLAQGQQMSTVRFNVTN